MWQVRPSKTYIFYKIYGEFDSWSKYYLNCRKSVDKIFLSSEVLSNMEEETLRGFESPSFKLTFGWRGDSY